MAIREGDPDLIDKIPDERNATTVEEVLAWLEEHNHPRWLWIQSSNLHPEGMRHSTMSHPLNRSVDYIAFLA